MDKVKNEYLPEVVSPPGDTLAEVLEKQGLTQAELAERTGRPKKTINEIIKGKAAITADTALQLERVLGVPAEFWNAREGQYREALARQEEGQKLSQETGWLKKFPLRELIKLGWIKQFEDRVEQLRELLRFFGVASPQQWRDVWLAPDAAYRTSPAFEAKQESVSAWLRRGEIEARDRVCKPYNEARFKESLHEIRGLSVEESVQVFLPKLCDLCADVGVAVVILRSIEGVRAHGATRWLTPEKALVQLSLRYLRDDLLWFTFFHECAHILLHSKKRTFIEEKNRQKDTQEREADLFSANFLIPPDAYAAFARAGAYSDERIRGFARQLGIAPGIVVGRLQYEGKIGFNHHTKLIRWFKWAEDE